MQTETVSLHSFCKDHDLAKTTVRRWLNEQGFSTADGLSAEAVEAAQAQFCPVPEPVEPEPPTEPEAPAAGGLTIDVGNHRGQLALPQPPSGIDLGAYRGENAALTSFAPEDIDRFLDACDGFVNAVNADYQQQQAVTLRKESAAAKVRSKVDQVKQASLIYQVRSETLAIHNRALDTELQEGLSTLGKPAAEAAPEL
jgi:hypothetical protein